jgi:hypothetical protein
VERTLSRIVGEEGSAVRVTSTDYLIIQPNLSRLAAQLRCLQCLREILTFFLGEARLADLAVCEVTAIAAEGVEVTRIEAAVVNAEQERQASAMAAAAPSGDQWSPFIASNGRRVRVSCSLEPVFELKGYSRIGYRVVRRVLVVGTDEPLPPIELARLTRADMERIDFATIARGLDRLRAEPGGDLQPSLILPVSFVSLSSLRSRTVLIGLFKQAQQVVKRGLICEVCDIDGVPQAALLTATSFIKPYCLFVVGRASADQEATTRNLRGGGLQAISMDAQGRTENETDLYIWARAAIAAAKTVAKSVMIYDLPDARGAAMMASLGATHASVRPNAGAG